MAIIQLCPNCGLANEKNKSVFEKAKPQQNCSCSKYVCLFLYTPECAQYQMKQKLATMDS